MGLEYLVTVAESGGFTQAAEKLFISQPAISRKISALEAELGMPLFVRTGRRNQLTGAGEIVYRWACQILKDYENLERDLTGWQHHGKPLRLVYFSNGSITYVSRAIRALKEKHPEVEVYAQSIQSLPTVDASFASGLEQLRQGKVDVLFSFLPNVLRPGMDWVDYRTVEKGGLCAVAGEGHPLFHEESVTAAQLKRYPLVFPNPRYTPEVARAMREALGEPDQVTDSTDFNDFCVRIISTGRVGVMPYSTHTVATESLHALPVSDVEEGFDLVALWKKDSPHPDLAALISVL